MHKQEFATVGSSSQASVLEVRGPGQISHDEKPYALWGRSERYDCGAEVCIEDRRGEDRRLTIVSGWACELRILPDGRRQIFGFLLPGDTIEARTTTNIASCGVIALTRLEIVSRRLQAAADDVDDAARIRAIEDEAVRREERLYDQLTRIGRLSAKERIMHLLLELYWRLERVRLVNGDTFRLPLTQEVFADALGLSIVHINRTLKVLRKEGLVIIHSGRVTLPNRDHLAARACYYPVDQEPASTRAAPRPWGCEGSVSQLRRATPAMAGRA